MKNPNAGAKMLTALLKRLPEAPAPTPGSDPIAILVESFLLWESTSDKAAKALEKLMAPLVDYNDMRVTMPSEMAEIVGDRTVGGLERFQRLRAVLRNVYLREHDVTLDRLRGSGKRDAKKYLDSLEGMVPYVAARMLLLAFDGHAVPADSQVLRALVEEGVLDDGTDLVEANAWLARHVKAGDGPRVHAALQAWVDGGAGRARAGAGRSTAKKAASKKTTKKAATKRKTPKKSTGGTGSTKTGSTKTDSTKTDSTKKASAKKAPAKSSTASQVAKKTAAKTTKKKTAVRR